MSSKVRHAGAGGRSTSSTFYTHMTWRGATWTKVDIVRKESGIECKGAWHHCILMLNPSQPSLTGDTVNNLGTTTKSSKCATSFDGFCFFVQVKTMKKERTRMVNKVRVGMSKRTITSVAGTTLSFLAVSASLHTCSRRLDVSVSSPSKSRNISRMVAKLYVILDIRHTIGNCGWLCRQFIVTLIKMYEPWLL